MMSSPPPSSPTRHHASLVAVHLGTVGRRGRLSCSQRKRDTYKTRSDLPKLISHQHRVYHCRRAESAARVTCTRAPAHRHGTRSSFELAPPIPPNPTFDCVPCPRRPVSCERPGRRPSGAPRCAHAPCARHSAIRPCAMRPPHARRLIPAPPPHALSHTLCHMEDTRNPISAHPSCCAVQRGS